MDICAFANGDRPAIQGRSLAGTHGRASRMASTPALSVKLLKSGRMVTKNVTKGVHAQAIQAGTFTAARPAHQPSYSRRVSQPFSGDDLSGSEQCTRGAFHSAGDSRPGRRSSGQVRLPTQLLRAVAAQAPILLCRCSCPRVE